MKPKSIIISAVVLITLLALGGAVWYGEERKIAEQSQNKPEDGTIEQNISNQEVPKTTQSEDLVWYDIPELGIRFKMTPEEKEELVYYFDKEFSTRDVQSVTFSTKTLELSSKYCSAKDGPLGGLMRVHVNSLTPKDPKIPCGGGQKVKEFPGGYFCYTHSQAICTWTTEDYEKYEKAPAEKYDKLFTSPDFWNAAEIK